MDRYIETQAIKELRLHNPLTEEEWDMINDWEFDRSDRVTFLTPLGKKVEFVKVVRCKDCRDCMEFTPEYKEKSGHYGTCRRLLIPMLDDNDARIKADDYCSYGERKEKE